MEEFLIDPSTGGKLPEGEGGVFSPAALDPPPLAPWPGEGGVILADSERTRVGEGDEDDAGDEEESSMKLLCDAEGPRPRGGVLRIPPVAALAAVEVGRRTLPSRLCSTAGAGPSFRCALTELTTSSIQSRSSACICCPLPCCCRSAGPPGVSNRRVGCATRNLPYFSHRGMSTDVFAGSTCSSSARLFCSANSRRGNTVM